MSIPISQFIPPPPLSPGDHKFADFLMQFNKYS